VTLCCSYSFTPVEYTFLPNRSPRLLISLFRGRPVRFATARIQRMLVHLVYLVYLVWLVDRTGNSFRRTRQTRKTCQPDRQARARCASTEDHQAPCPPLFREQEDDQAARLLSKLAHRPLPAKGCHRPARTLPEGRVSADDFTPFTWVAWIGSNVRA
jgi:hypothetical protein